MIQIALAFAAGAAAAYFLDPMRGEERRSEASTRVRELVDQAQQPETQEKLRNVVNQASQAASQAAGTVREQADSVRSAFRSQPDSDQSSESNNQPESSPSGGSPQYGSGASGQPAQGGPTMSGPASAYNGEMRRAPGDDTPPSR